jgi:hypothetical protein
VNLPTGTAAPSPVLLECDVTPGVNTALDIHGGPGTGFRVVGQLLPGRTARALLHTDTGFVYVVTGWIERSLVNFTPEDACAALPLISAQDSSAAAVCTISAVPQRSDLRVDPNPGANRAYRVRSGTTLSVFRVVVGADGQRWYYAVTNDAAWHFGWMPAPQAVELTACPPAEAA